MEDSKPTDSPAGIADGEIEELIRLEAKATPGKWVCEYSIDDQRSNSLGEESMIRVDGSDPGSANGLVVGTIYYDGIVLAMTENDGYFIVAMRNHLKPLIQRLKHAEAERDRLKEALELPEPSDHDKAGGWTICTKRLAAVQEIAETKTRLSDTIYWEDIEAVLRANHEIAVAALAAQETGEGKS